MLNFEVINELSLKVTCTGNDVLFTKAGAFIAGESQGGKIIVLKNCCSITEQPDAGSPRFPDKTRHP